MTATNQRQNTPKCWGKIEMLLALKYEQKKLPELP